MQTFLPIEIVILRRVNQIKSRDPAHDAGPRISGGSASWPVCAIQAATGAIAKARPRKKCRRVSKMFGERVEKNNAERDRRKHECEPIDVCSKENKQRPGTEDEEMKIDAPGREIDLCRVASADCADPSPNRRSD